MSRPDLTPAEFCDAHDACADCREWALTQPDMLAVWREAKYAWLIWIARRVLSDKEFRLFVCFCARQNWHLLSDPRSRKAVEVAEAYCRGEASDEELAAAAANAAAVYVANPATYHDAAVYAANAATSHDASTAAREVTTAAQCAWLRERCVPDFSRERGDAK